MIERTREAMKAGPVKILCCVVLLLLSACSAEISNFGPPAGMRCTHGHDEFFEDAAYAGPQFVCDEYVEETP